MTITAIAGLSHTLSTVMIGIAVGFVGYKLSGSYFFIVAVIAPKLADTAWDYLSWLQFSI